MKNPKYTIGVEVYVFFSMVIASCFLWGLGSTFEHGNALTVIFPILGIIWAITGIISMLWIHYLHNN